MTLSKSEWTGVAILLIAISVIFLGVSRLVKIGLDHQRVNSSVDTYTDTSTDTSTDIMIKVDE